MVPPPLPLDANAVIPVNNNTYFIQSIAYNHSFNLAYLETYDGAVIQGYTPVIATNEMVCGLILLADPYPIVLISLVIAVVTSELSGNGRLDGGYAAELVHPGAAPCGI